MTAIINKKTPIDSEYLQHNDKFLDKLESDAYQICPYTSLLILLILLILLKPATSKLLSSF